MAEPMKARLRIRASPLRLQTQLKEPPKTSKERSAEFYARLKASPHRYHEKLLEQRERTKKNREEFKKNASEEEKERIKAMNRERVRRFRAKKKDAGVLQSTKSIKPMTRKMKEKGEERKKKDKERKQLERAKWSTQKRVAENKKARDRYLKKKSIVQDETPEECDGGKIDRTPAARAMAVSRLNRSLPRNKEAKQATIEDFIQQHKNKENIPSLKSTTHLLLSSEGLCKKEGLTLKRLLAKKLKFIPKQQRREIGKELNLRSDQIEKLASKANGPLKRKKVKQAKTVKDVHTFFQDNARILPLKRKAFRQPSQVLERTLRILYKEYIQSYNYISFSTFCRFRPNHVKTQAAVKFNQALCEHCENLDLKLKAINSALQPPMAKNREDLLSKIMCEKRDGNFYKPECIKRGCNECGPEKIWHLIGEKDLEKKVELRQWEMKEIMHSGKTMRRKALVRKEVTIQEVVRKMEVDLKSFPLHNFRGKWQYSQFNQKKKDLKEGELLCVLDFAENYRCSLQDEVQSAHWNYCQATVHPIVSYYICPTCKDTTTESTVIISDDLTHDSAAVQCFTKAAYDHLLKKIEIKRLIQFTDGCSAQYKSKQPFEDIRNSERSIGMPIERNFFGSRHGKNPSDGESAVFKNAAMRAVKARRSTIQTAEDLFTFGCQNLEHQGECLHFQRKFLFVDSPVVKAVREKRKGEKLTTLKGTRDIHSIKVEDGVLVFRDASCFCSEDPCRNRLYVDDWRRHSPQTRKTITNDNNACECEPSADSDLHLLSESTLEFLDDLNEGTVEHEAVAEVEESLMPAGVGEPAVAEEAAVEEIIIPVGVEELAVAEEAERKETIIPGVWVAASFPGKVSKKYFLGMVLEVDGGEASVKFSRQQGTCFTWPIVEDLGWMPFYSLTAIEAPIVDTRERMFVNQAVFSNFFK